MNKTQLVDALAERLGDRRTAATAVEGLLETIVDRVRSGETVTLTGFGVFESRARAARVARNPRTGATVEVPATTVPAFRPGAGFRTAVGTAAPVEPVAKPAVRPAAAAVVAPEVAEPAKAAKGTKVVKGAKVAKDVKGKGRDKKDQDKAGKGKKVKAKK